MFTPISTVALFAGLAAAYHPPVGPTPKGNEIHAPLVEVVPACKPYEIKWTPDTKNTLSIILLRGPSNNVVYLDTIVEGIANTGSYTWTPKASLEADTTHYGIQLIDDVTGQYQYSPQFGISKEACGKESASASGASGYPVSTPAGPKSTPVKSGYSSGSVAPTTTKVIVASTGQPASNTSVITGTKPLTVPTSLQTSATAGITNDASISPTATGKTPLSSGAASALNAGLGFAGAMAAAAFML